MTPTTPPRPGTFGARLRELRTSRGWTQAQLASAASDRLQPKHIYAYEKGKRQPAFGNLCNLARALDVSLSELLEGVAA
jgi:transcriptional regulator with XRE-family HTH domain